MFRKPKKKPTALRSTGASGGSGSARKSSDDPDERNVNNTNNPQSFHPKARKRLRTTTASSSSEEDNDNSDKNDNDDEEENTSELLRQIRQERDSKTDKKSIKKSTKSGGETMHHYRSSQTHQLSGKEMATRTAEYHPEKATAKATDALDAVTTNANLPSLQKQTNKFHAGPLRAATFVRTTARFDYQPDICKDYKETGFCGFGDTCIYLHDRGDSKTGWEMEREYEEKKKREEEGKRREMERFMSVMAAGGGDGEGVGDGGDGFGEEDDKKKGLDDGIPFACHLCRGPFKNPIVTTCGHYFCEACMLKRIRGTDGANGEENGGGGTTGCPICQKDTHGVLNHAQKLVAKKRRLVGRDGSWEEYLNSRNGRSS